MFLVLWSSVGKKTALLVFSALGLASAKTKCAVCAWAFQYAAQRLAIWHEADCE
jgi:Mn2+/Fe2+ NRAMP family transporter